MASAAIVATEHTPLTVTPSADEEPALSPDGTLIAFVSDRDGNKDLWVMNADGSQPRQLTHTEGVNVYCSDPHWSPDGKYLVYATTRGEGDDLDLWMVSVDGQDDHPLTTEPSDEWMPCWSPDGRQIAFVTDREGADAIWIMDVDGKNPRPVLTGAWEPAWSPGGEKLACYAIRQNQDGVWMVDVAGGEPELILPGGKEPCWSPDGLFIVAVKPVDEVDRLWIVDVERKRAHPLATLEGAQRSPSWGAEGRLLVYESDQRGTRDVWRAVLRRTYAIVNFLSPLPQATVRGTVPIAVRVRGEGVDIDRYRLEYGRGPHPQSWTQLMEGTGAVEGEVFQWDTAGLEGVYTLRLTAVDSEGGTTETTTLVTIFGQYGVVYVEHTVPVEMVAGTVYEATITLRNTGSMTWRHDGPFAVYGSYQWLTESGEVVVPEGLRTPLPRDVSTGEEIVLTVSIAAPARPGQYRLVWDLKQGGQIWFREQGAAALELAVKVKASYAVEYRVASPPTTMVPGQIYTLQVTLRNLGAAPWPGPEGTTAEEPTEPVALSYRWKNAQGAWVDLEPLRTPLPHTVQPGETVTLDARIQAPSVSGQYILYWDLVQGDRGWFSDRHRVLPYSTPVLVSALYAAEFLEHNTPTRMFPGEIYVVNVRLRNTGSVRWRAEGANAVRMTYRWLSLEGIPIGERGLVTSLPYDVPAAHTVEVTARVQAPGQPGEYTLQWDLERAGGFAFSQYGSPTAEVLVKVGAPSYGVEFSPRNHPTKMIVGQAYTVEMTLRNTGAMTWAAEGPEAVRLGYHWFNERGEELTLAAPVFTELGHSVDQGDKIVVTARVLAPSEPGQYTLKWDLRQGERGWFSELGGATLNVPVEVEIMYGAEYLSHDTPPEMVAGQRYRVNVRVKNTGTIPWEAGGPIPITLSYRWLDEGGTVAEVERLKARLPHDVPPGETVDIPAFVRAPSQPGKYSLEWDLYLGEAFWFSEKGVPPLRVRVTVK